MLCLKENVWGENMDKNRVFFIFLLIFFFITLNSVFAMDANSTVIKDNAVVDDTAVDSILSATDDNNKAVLTNGNQIIVNEGDSIQSAIDNAVEGSTIIVNQGKYSEDLVISKGLSIIGQNAILNSNKIAFNILSTANNTSISGFNIIVSDVNGTGIFVNASNCKITDNKITGGNFGVFSEYYISNKSGQIEFFVINNLSILKNNFSGISEAGISIAAYNPIVSQNRVKNIVNNKVNGTASGIKVNGVGVIPDDLKVVVTNNYVSNVKSLKDSAYGMDVGGNSIFDSLTIFKVSGNVIENVLAAVEAYGMNVGIFSLNSTLPTINVNKLNISHISAGNYENGSAIGLSVSVTTIGQNVSSDAIIKNNHISDLKALGKDATVTGITTTGTGCVDLYVLNNNLDGFKASKSITGMSVTGIDYNNFKSFIDVSNNDLTNFDASNIKGINVLSLGDATIRKNILYNLKSKDSTFITGVTLSIEFDNINLTIPENASIEDIKEFIKKLDSKLNDMNFTINGDLSIYGNNLDGVGTGTAFAVIRPATINYNRATNFKNNVVKESTRKFLLESYGYDPSMSSEELAYLMLKSQQTFENCTEEELRNMSVSFGAFLDKFFNNLDNLTAGNVDARYNWWGSNSKPKASKFKNNNGKVIYNPWLVMTVKSNPSIIKKGQFSKITVDVYKDSSGLDHSANSKLFFSGPKVTLSTDLGSFKGKKSITLNWTNGKAVAYLKGDKTGLANVTASDYGKSHTTVLIIDGNKTDGPGVYSAKSSKTMPPAGNPIVLLVIVIFLLSSVGMYKRK